MNLAAMREEKAVRLNLGCGYDRKDGWTNTDREVDLNKFPYPWKDSSVDEILMRGVLDFLEFPGKVICECWRILKPNGRITISVPFFNSIAAIADVDDKHYFYGHSMDIFDGRHSGHVAFDKRVKFRITKTTYTKNPSLIFKLVPVKLCNWVFNLCLGVTWEMEAIKE